MKRAGAWALLTLATLYTLFVIALIFVGSFTTAHIFPGDHNGNKAIGFGFFSGLFLIIVWLAGSLLLSEANDEAQEQVWK